MHSAYNSTRDNKPIRSIRAISRKFAGNTLFLFLILLILPSLACAQAGEILTPAEATARAEPQSQISLPPGNDASVTPTPDDAVPETPFAAGDEVALAGKGFLINLMDAPDGNRIVGSQERGARVTVLEITLRDETVWVRIQAATGEGWVMADNLSVEP